MSPYFVSPLLVTKQWITPTKSEVTIRRLSTGEENSIKPNSKPFVRKNPRMRGRMYSSGEDSWEEERRKSRRNDKLEVPGSRSRSNTSSKSPKRHEYGSPREKSASGRKSPFDHFGTGRMSPFDQTKKSPRRHDPKKSPSPSSRYDVAAIFGKKSSPSQSRRSPVDRRSPRRSPRDRDRDFSPDYYDRHRGSHRSPTYERSRRRSYTPEDYYRDYHRHSKSGRQRSSRERRELSEELEKYHHYKKNFDRYETEQTESSADDNRKQKKVPEKFVDPLFENDKIDRKSSKSTEDKRLERDTHQDKDVSDTEYENYPSPIIKVNAEIDNGNGSPWGETSPLDQILSHSVDNHPINTNTEHDQVNDQTKVETIIVQPVEKSSDTEDKLYSAQFKPVEDSNYLSAMIEDDKDSGIGFTLCDFKSDYNDDVPVKKEKEETFVTMTPPKQWTLFSFSANGPLKVKDEETGEIFTIINEIPILEDSQNDEYNVKENEPILDEEDDISWCSFYLIGRIIGLGLVIAGLAGMVYIALP